MAHVILGNPIGNFSARLANVKRSRFLGQIKDLNMMSDRRQKVNFYLNPVPSICGFNFIVQIGVTYRVDKLHYFSRYCNY